jgi:hypothetical protein
MTYLGIFYDCLTLIRSCDPCLQFLKSIVFKSASTESSHLVAGISNSQFIPSLSSYDLELKINAIIKFNTIKLATRSLWCINEIRSLLQICVYQFIENQTVDFRNVIFIVTVTLVMVTAIFVSISINATSIKPI